MIDIDMENKKNNENAQKYGFSKNKNMNWLNLCVMVKKI